MSLVGVLAVVAVYCGFLLQRQAEVFKQPLVEKAIPGFLILRVDPKAARLSLVGRKERWEGERGLALLPGVYRIRAEAEGYESAEREVRVHAEDASVYRLKLTPQPVPVVIESHPVGAKIFLNQRPYGKTPFVAKLEPRAYRVRFELPSFVSVENDILIRPHTSKAPPVPQKWRFSLGGAPKAALDGGKRRFVSAGYFSRGLSQEDLRVLLALCEREGRRCDAGWWSAEEPQRLIHLQGFWMDQEEVSFARYGHCVKAGACTKARFHRTNLHLPVIGVSWSQAAAYCRWAGGMLPSEAAWELAGRGRDARLFAWGREWLPKAANHGIFLPLRGVSAPWDGDGAMYAAPVGSFPKDRSPFSIHDLTGNLAEWVADCYHASIYRIDAERSPFYDRPACSMRVVRGGSWESPPWDLRLTARQPLPPATQSPSLGFRCMDTQPL
jgi:formylglycine-generating enzyme required for sulfatase activity